MVSNSCHYLFVFHT